MFMSCTTMQAIDNQFLAGSQGYFQNQNDPARQGFFAETSLLFALQNPPVDQCPGVAPLPK